MNELVIKEFLYKIADDQLILGHRNSEWTGFGPLLEEVQCHSYRELYERAQRDASRHIPQRIIDAISTKETSFFRDQTPFDLLKCKLLPDYFDRVRGTANGTVPHLSLWSAACSTGEEPFTIACSLLEELGMPAASRIHILASDISSRALAAAERGAYESDRFKDFPKDFGGSGEMISE